MSSLLESPIAAQASSVTGGVTSGAVARMANDAATLPQSEVSTIQGGRRRQRRSSKRRSSTKGRKSQRRRSKRLRRPFFLL
jgi:hypothetical protein